MRVSLAVQVLSHSVGAGLRTYVGKDRLPQTALQTADFVERVNDLFDVGNSRTIQDGGSKSPITADSLQRVVSRLQIDLKWVQDWRFEDQRTDDATIRNSLPFQKGLLITLSSLCRLAKRL